MSHTDETRAAIRRLWSQGLSTREIGLALGITKNAVVGLAHRMGLERPSPIIRRPKPDPLPPARERCQWIEGEPSADDACKCGEPVIANPLFRPYCEDHLRRSIGVRVARKPSDEELARKALPRWMTA